MQRCIFSFFCVFFCALVSCSPKIISGRQEARAYESASLMDSLQLRRLIDTRMEAYFEHYLSRAAELRQETVREQLSAPDSAGRQYVSERSTTRSVARSQTSAGMISGQSGQTVELSDSSSVHDMAAAAEMEIYEEKSSAVDAPAKKMRWFFYALSLLGAVIIGFILGLRGGKWISCR